MRLVQSKDSLTGPPGGFAWQLASTTSAGRKISKKTWRALVVFGLVVLLLMAGSVKQTMAAPIEARVEWLHPKFPAPGERSYACFAYSSDSSRQYTYTFEWLRNGEVVRTTEPRPYYSDGYQATQVGTYACRVTVVDSAGSKTTVTSQAFTITADIRIERYDVRLLPRRGIALLQLTAAWNGSVLWRGRGLITKRRQVVEGLTRIAIRPSRRLRKRLRQRGRATVKVRIFYTPAGGETIPHTRTVVLRQRRAGLTRPG